MKYLSILLIMLFVYSCSNSIQPDPVPIDPPIDSSFTELIPLKTGNFWLYEYRSLKKDGSLDEIFKNDDGFIVNDSSSKSYNGKQLFTYKISRYHPVDNHIDSKGYFIFNNMWGTNLFSTTESENEVHNPKLLFSDPNRDTVSSANPVYFLNSINNPDIHQKTTTLLLINKDTVITTPYGKFDCSLYYTKIQPLPIQTVMNHYYYFISPGIGIVQMITKIQYPPDNKKYWFSIDYLSKYKIN